MEIVERETNLQQIHDQEPAQNFNSNSLHAQNHFAHSTLGNWKHVKAPRSLAEDNIDLLSNMEDNLGYFN